MSEVKTLLPMSVFLVVSSPGRMAGTMEGHDMLRDVFQNKTESTTQMAVQIAPAQPAPFEYNFLLFHVEIRGSGHLPESRWPRDDGR